jgi:hypothetical protein
MAGMDSLRFVHYTEIPESWGELWDDKKANAGQIVFQSLKGIEHSRLTHPLFTTYYLTGSYYRYPLGNWYQIQCRSLLFLSASLWEPVQKLLN